MKSNHLCVGVEPVTSDNGQCTAQGLYFMQFGTARCAGRALGLYLWHQRITRRDNPNTGTCVSITETFVGLNLPKISGYSHKQEWKCVN
jgi:hypothetical protein